VREGRSQLRSQPERCVIGQPQGIPRQGGLGHSLDLARIRPPIDGQEFRQIKGCRCLPGPDRPVAQVPHRERDAVAVSHSSLAFRRLWQRQVTRDSRSGGEDRESIDPLPAALAQHSRQFSFFKAPACKILEGDFRLPYVCVPWVSLGEGLQAGGMIWRPVLIV